MENASKALIIAGAILISILLISVGVMIISSTDGITDSTGATMTEYEISTFNSKFLNYEGRSQKASQVKALISAVANSNSANEADSASDEKFVAITYDPLVGSNLTTTDPNTTINNIRAEISSTTTYNITCNVDTVSGLVNQVTIEEEA